MLENQVIITGASGFVGAQLIRHLQGGYLVSRSESRPRYANWQWLTRSDALQFSHLQPAPRTLIHLEVKQHISHLRSGDIATFQRVNVDGTREWLDWCTQHGVNRFIYFSSIKAVRPALQGATDETAAGPGPSPYGASKWGAESLVRRWVEADRHRSGLILRPAPIYGPTNASNLAAMVMAIASRYFFLVGRNDNIKSLVSVQNVGAAAVHLMNRMRLGHCETFNICDERSFTVREIDRLIRKYMGKVGNSPTLPKAVGRILAKAGDCFYSLTGWNFPFNSARFGALTESTDFSPAKLLSTGFRFPQCTEAGFIEMLDWFKKSQ